MNASIRSSARLETLDGCPSHVGIATIRISASRIRSRISGHSSPSLDRLGDDAGVDLVVGEPDHVGGRRPRRAARRGPPRRATRSWTAQAIASACRRGKWRACTGHYPERAAPVSRGSEPVTSTPVSISSITCPSGSVTNVAPHAVAAREHLARGLDAVPRRRARAPRPGRRHETPGGSCSRSRSPRVVRRVHRLGPPGLALADQVQLLARRSRATRRARRTSAAAAPRSARARRCRSRTERRTSETSSEP